MLRDDAIREGLLKPTKADKERMGLNDIPRPDEVFDTADEGEGIEAVIDLKDLTYNELRKKAGELGIDVPRGCKKPALIELIKEKS